MAAPELTTDWSQFDPKEYLHEYYTDLGAENLALLRFLVEAYQDVRPNAVLLDFGGGPTIYPLIAAAQRVREIHFSDYLDANLEEVRRWLRGEEAAFDWSKFIRKTLELESGRPCTADHVARREREIRRRLTRVVRCDASRTPPINDSAGAYDVVVTNFCAESATSDRAQWRTFMYNIGVVLKPGGKLILSALEQADCYSVGARFFPAVNVTEDDLAETLVESGFSEKDMVIHSVPADRSTRLYRGLLLAIAKKELVSDDWNGTCRIPS